MKTRCLPNRDPGGKPLGLYPTQPRLQPYYKGDQYFGLCQPPLAAQSNQLPSSMID